MSDCDKCQTETEKIKIFWNTLNYSLGNMFEKVDLEASVIIPCAQSGSSLKERTLHYNNLVDCFIIRGFFWNLQSQLRLIQIFWFEFSLEIKFDSNFYSKLIVSRICNWDSITFCSKLSFIRTFTRNLFVLESANEIE